MRLYLYERFIIKTTLPPEIILQELDTAIGTENYENCWWKISKLYHGKINGHHFSAVRFARNNPSPRIIGKIIPQTDACTILMTIKPRVTDFLVFIFILFVSEFICLSSVPDLLLNIFPSPNTQVLVYLLSFLISLVVLLIIYFVMLLFFNYEAKESKSFFCQLVDGKTTANTNEGNQ